METIEAPGVTAGRDTALRMHTVEVLVNFKTVVLPSNEITGFDIKQSAISQGVGIQIDFVLFQDHGHGRRDLIRDDEVVHAHRGDRFEAIPGDDNS